MALNSLDGKTRDLVAASYALPDLETAVKQVIYNSIDAHAKRITLSVDVAKASFTALDDGDGIQPDDLYEYVGEFYASSKVPSSTYSRKEQNPQMNYGSRGAFLQELTSLAAKVEIESRVQEHWTSYRKVFKDGDVTFNARSKELRETPGTKISVSNLFGKLPVRYKDLSRNRKYRSRVVQNIHNFCVSMSMIWPSLSFHIQYEGEEGRPVMIPPAKSCRERFLSHFGQLLGNELHYVDFSSKMFPYSIRGYVAFIPSGPEGLGQGIKQAKSYYQFAYIENKWVEECHELCSRMITEAALQIVSAIPIFVLKIAAPSDHYDVSRVGKKDAVLFKTPEQLHRFLFEFVENLATADWNQNQICAQGSNSDPATGQSVHDSEKEAAPRYFDCPQTSDYAQQDWRNEERPTMLRQTDNYAQMGHSNGDFLAEDDGQLSRKLEIYSELSKAFEEHSVLVERQHSGSVRIGNPVRCHACGHVSATEVSDDSNDSSAAGSLALEASDYESADFAFSSLAQEDADGDRAEDYLESIFFSNKQDASVVEREETTGVETSEADVPWLSSKPDAYDCADVLVDLCQKNDCNESTYQCKDVKQSGDEEQENRMQSAGCNQSCGNCSARSPVQTSVIAGSSTTSAYFAVGSSERPANNFLKHWVSSKVAPVKHLAGAMCVDNVRSFKGDQQLKITKSTLAKLQVIRQVDRKFILVQADTSRGKLVLCIDQHAADERVQLEKLEETMFGHDGSLRRVKIQEHEPPLVLWMNYKEREALYHYEDVIRSWGFHFVFIASEPETNFSMRRELKSGGDSRVCLHATPKVEKRAANADDFRDFIQLLSSVGETCVHSQIRPPVITRLLHSRACRSAIMFGDHLSLGQCRDLIEELKTCHLPFQCAHGRPSVVPLVEIQPVIHDLR